MLSVDTRSLAGDGQIGTWESAHDAIHVSTPASAVELGHIGINRRFLDRTTRHMRRQNFAGTNFVLNVQDELNCWQRDSDGKIESSRSTE